MTYAFRHWKSSNNPLAIIQNPLVVVLGIGIYHGYTSIDEMSKDYKNMIHIFHDVWGYTIFYKNSKKNSKTNTIIKHASKTNAHLKTCKCKQRRYYKKEWTDEEVIQFCNDAQQEITNPTKSRKQNNTTKSNKSEYDALIFIISSHGEDDNIILDSNCEEISLLEIYGTFSSENCPTLADKPKLFFVDACRGSVKEKAAKFVPPKVKNNQRKMSETVSEEIKLKKGDNDEKDMDDEKKNKIVDKSANIHSQANFYKVYANPSGYAAIAGTKGGILINAIKLTFVDVKTVLKSTLDDIFRQIIVESYNQSKFLSIQQPQVENTLKFQIKFTQYTE